MARRRAPVRHQATLHLLVVRQAGRGCAARLQLEQAGRADDGVSMKFVQPRPFADPDLAARKIVEIKRH